LGVILAETYMSIGGVRKDIQKKYFALSDLGFNLASYRHTHMHYKVTFFFFLLLIIEQKRDY